MKRIIKLLGLGLLVISQLFTLNFFAQAQQQQQPDESWKNRYAINPSEIDPANTIKYARQMGYDYIAIRPYIAQQTSNVYLTDSQNNPKQKLNFFIIDPYYMPFIYFVSKFPSRDTNGKLVLNPKNIDVTPGTGYNYTQAQIDWYSQRMVWIDKTSTTPNYQDQLSWAGQFAFGGNSVGGTTVLQANWDFQQQMVIDEVVNGIIAAALTFESNTGMPFAGVFFDVPVITGTFYKPWSVGSGLTTLEYWMGTGNDFGASHIGLDGTTNKQYLTYSDGLAAFYKKLNYEMKQRWPNAKWLVEPARIYSASLRDEYVLKVNKRKDKDLLTPDFLAEEGATTDFVDEPLNFNSGMNITKDMVGSQQPNRVEEDANRLIAAKAGINGAWYSWSMRFGGTQTMPDFQSITQVYPRLKLIRAIPNWDNLNNITLRDRSCDQCNSLMNWNPNSSNPPPSPVPTDLYYESKDSTGGIQSHIDSDVMYSRHWKTGKLFAVFNTNTSVGKITLKPGESVTSVHRATPYFEEEFNDLNGNGVRDSGESLIDASQDITIAKNILGDEITLNSSVIIDVDLVGIKGVGIGQVKGNGYIFTIGQSATAPTATTKKATNIAFDSATLNGLVNPKGADITNNIYFDYGTSPGNYAGQINANPNSISASSGDTSVGANLNGLPSSITYYYRVVATNSVGTTNGNEMSFTTSDNSAPSVPQNLVATAISSSQIDLSWSASIDNVGVAGYRVYRGTTLIASVTSGTSYSDTGLLANTAYSYTVSAYDTAGNTSAQSNPASATTLDNNRAPILTAIGDKQVNENTLLKFTISATDPEGDSLTYSASSMPQGAILDPATQTFSWTPSYSQSGNYLVTFNVSDGKLTDNETITITVNNINRAPVLTVIGNKTVDENSPLQFTISASDSDNDTLTYSATSLPTGASFSVTTRTFSWTPTYSQSGSYNVTFSVSDGILSIAETIMITVKDIGVTAAPTVVTGHATGVTKTSAILNGSVNPNGLGTAVWFEYGTVSGSYSKQTTRQELRGSSVKEISIQIKGLSIGRTYYYRIVAKNSQGTSYGGQSKFTTLRDFR